MILDINVASMFFCLSHAQDNVYALMMQMNRDAIETILRILIVSLDSLMVVN